MVVRLRQDRRAEQRTLKYLRAAIRGVWVVGLAWVDACLVAGRLVPEAPFEATVRVCNVGCTGGFEFNGRCTHAMRGLAGCRGWVQDCEYCNFTSFWRRLQGAGAAALCVLLWPCRLASTGAGFAQRLSVKHKVEGVW